MCIVVMVASLVVVQIVEQVDIRAVEPKTESPISRYPDCVVAFELAALQSVRLPRRRDVVDPHRVVEDSKLPLKF